MLALAALAAAALALPAGAGAHAERATFFPNPDQGAFPEYRTTGPALVVCAATPSSASSGSTARSGVRRYQRQLKDCAYDTIQAAVNDAQNGTRILVMPGVYRGARAAAGRHRPAARTSTSAPRPGSSR